MAPTAAHPPRVEGQDVHILLGHPWFSALSPGLRAQMLALCTIRRYAARELVYAIGSPGNGLFAVLRGEVRLEHYSEGGKYAFYQSMPPGEFFGLLSEIDGSPRFSDARAAADTVLLHLPHPQLQALYRDNPEAREAFVQHLCRNLHATLHILVGDRSEPPRAKIARVLVSLFSHAPESGASAPRLTQEALAAMAGVSRQTTNKILRDLRARGLVDTPYGRIQPRDLRALDDFARDEAG